MKGNIYFVLVHVYYSECSQPEPLGMEDGTIGTSQITASSYYIHVSNKGVETIQYAWKGRLNGMIEECWCSIEKDPNLWFRVDFLSVVTMTAIKIQGCRLFGPEFVTELQIATGNSQDSLFFIRDDIGMIQVSLEQHV